MLAQACPMLPYPMMPMVLPLQPSSMALGELPRHSGSAAQRGEATHGLACAQGHMSLRKPVCLSVSVYGAHYDRQPLQVEYGA